MKMVRARYKAPVRATSGANDLRRVHGPHDIVVRARSDTLFHQNIDLARLMPSVRASRVLALAFNDSNEEEWRSQWLWRDWIYIGTEVSMNAMAEMTDKPFTVYVAPAKRCAGFCPEEQVELQLAHRQLKLDTLSCRTSLVRMSRTTKFSPLVKASIDVCSHPMKLTIGSIDLHRFYSTGAVVYLP